MAQSTFSLKDQLLNAQSVGQLADEVAHAWSEFDKEAFQNRALSRFPDLELKARLNWIAECLEDWLPSDFDAMAAQILRAQPPILDPTKSDDDFGNFIHAPWGILVARHGKDDPELALDTLAELTKRFTAELVIRDFVSTHPEMSYAKFEAWARSENYHLRRLVSEGTRPLLPWAQRIATPVDFALPLLDVLHSDPTRYVTRSVANHLNDIAKIAPSEVPKRLKKWAETSQQEPKELAWMTRHATRTLVKKGDPEALALLGYPLDPPIEILEFSASDTQVPIGSRITLQIKLRAKEATKLLLDYVVDFPKAGGRRSEKVHKIKSLSLKAGESLDLEKVHFFKGDATTYKLYPGNTPIQLQINGQRLALCEVDLTA
ncbi:MAG: hypothetical protein AAGD04_11880 [Pseudomonadota bacterium]